MGGAETRPQEPMGGAETRPQEPMGVAKIPTTGANGRGGKPTPRPVIARSASVPVRPYRMTEVPPPTKENRRSIRVQ